MKLNLLRHNLPGFYVYIDGPDGTGKSSLVKNLDKLLTNSGLTVAATAEPMNMMYGSLIRNRFNATEDSLGYRYELAYAFCADRQYHQSTVILPALIDGEVVIQDRGSISTLVYQIDLFDGHPEVLFQNVVRPDLAILLVCNEDDFRKRRDGGKNIYERMSFPDVSARFHQEFVDNFGEDFYMYDTSVYTSPNQLALIVAGVIETRRRGINNG